MDGEKRVQAAPLSGETERLAKKKAEAEYAGVLRTLGNLTEPEISELVDLEITAGPKNLNEQIRRYYLKLKSEKPEKAEQLLENLKEVKLDEPIKKEDISRIGGILRKYWSGYVIYHDGKIYNSREI